MSNDAPASARQPVRAATAAFAGTTIEWYDFFIYSTASALVFPQLFFPSSDPNVSLMISLATFGVGFFARPLGVSSSVIWVTGWAEKKRSLQRCC
jgi:MFS family permease